MLGIEPTPALLGVGYILGYRIAAIMVAGGLLSWLGLIPIIAHFGEMLERRCSPTVPRDADADPGHDGADEIWSRYIRYIGAGAVATAGIIAVIEAAADHGRLGPRGRCGAWRARGETAPAARPRAPSGTCR